MAYVPLVPCARCHRHVRVGERTCPFCRSELRQDSPGALAAAGTMLAIASALALGGCSRDEPAAPDQPLKIKSNTSATGPATLVPSPTATVDDPGSTADKYGLPPLPGPRDAGAGDALAAAPTGAFPTTVPTLVKPPPPATVDDQGSHAKKYGMPPISKPKYGMPPSEKTPRFE